MTDIPKLERMAAEARPLNDDEWGSERQIKAQNAFFIEMAAQGFETDRYDCIKASGGELIDIALKEIREYAVSRAFVIGMEGIGSEEYVVHYSLLNHQNDSRWVKFTLGPFQDRAVAEQALANLASNPGLRGAEIKVVEED